MPASLPYLVTYKNLPTLFEKISAAKVPETFTHNFLQTAIGLKGSNDRALIPFLRHLSFIDQSGKPTPSYRLLKGDKQRAAIATGVRKAYGPLFDADQNAYQLSGEKLKSLVAQVAGTDSDLTGRIANTFSSVVKLGDFSHEAIGEDKIPVVNENGDKAVQETTDTPRKGGLRAEFHYNIQVQLPSNGTEETYLNIFNALRRTFQ